MIVKGLTKELPAVESEGINEVSDLKAREMEVDNGGGKELRSFRRKRMELRSLNSLSREKSAAGDPLISPDHEPALKKKRSEVKNGKKVIDRSVEVYDAGGSRCGKMAHLGRRREMEDAAAAELGFLRRGGRSYDFYGVYDGHGGWRVAQACSETMHKMLAKVVGDGVEMAWEEVMAAVFKGMDEEVNKSGAEVATMGSTAVVAVVGEEEVVVANCGDSRAVLCRGGVAIQLSDDHKPDRPDELERIEVCGGKVIHWNGARVLGVLSTSRSIGDHYLKPFVIPDPEVKIIDRTDSDEFLILASDGLWDVVSNELACRVARRCLDGRLKRGSLFPRLMINKDDEESGQLDKTVNGNRCFEAAAVLAELAMGKGSCDNVSVVVVDMS